VYKQILKYYKEYEEKKTLGNTEFHHGKSLKKKKTHPQKRGMQLYKWCFNCIEKQHLMLSKEEVHDVMEGIYDEVYSGSNCIVLHYRDLVKNQVSTQGAGDMETHLAKVLKVYQKRLSYWKESDQRRRLKQAAEEKPEKKELDEKVATKTPKTAVQDLILGDKGSNIGEAHEGLYKTVRKPFFTIEWFRTKMKKFVHFLTNGVSVSVLLGEESEPKPRAHKPKRKRGEEDGLPAMSSPSYEMRVGLDPGLCYLFVAKNNSNPKDKKLSAKMSSNEYYHESKFNWNKSKQNKCYTRCP
jgi:hypothetical protein